MPYFFHDVILTVERTDFNVKNDIYFSEIPPDRKVIKELGIEYFFNEADTNYDKNFKTGRACPDFTLYYYRNFCQSEGEIPSYKAYQIMEKFTFNHQSMEFNSATMGDSDGKMYVVYLRSPNWEDSLIRGSIISIIGILFSVWVFVRNEKHLTRLQNHTVGATLATFVALFIILSILRISTEPLILYPPFSVMFAGPPFLVTYAGWYFIFGKKLINSETK